MAWKDNLGIVEELTVELVSQTVEVSIDALEDIARCLDKLVIATPVEESSALEEILMKVRQLIR